MTTWSNTLNIIFYLNFYLRNLPFKRDELGLIENNSEHTLYVSGDD